jgi:hypothetical protein
VLVFDISWTRRMVRKTVEHRRAKRSRNSEMFRDVAAAVKVSVTLRHSLLSSFRHAVTCK